MKEDREDEVQCPMMRRIVEDGMKNEEKLT
jgi:hypothetical protein